MSLKMSILLDITILSPILKRRDVFVVFHTLNRNYMHSELIELIFTRLEV